MKILLTFVLIQFFFSVNAQSSTNASGQSISEISQKSQNIFFHGTKLFCSYYRKTKYKLFIKGNEISITAVYNGASTIKGIIKNGKIYSDDQLEKGNKMLAGKVYIFRNNAFRVLTSEGGEYDEFTECKE